MIEGTPSPQARKAPVFERETLGAAQFKPSPMNDHVPVVSIVVAKYVGRYVTPDSPNVVMFTKKSNANARQSKFCAYI